MEANKRYYKDIKKLFPVYGKKERAYLKKIHEQINEFDNMSYSDLEDAFGTPIDVVKSYYDTLESSYLLKRMNIKKIVNAVCLFLIMVIILYFGYRAYILKKAYDEIKDTVPTEFEEVIEEVD